MKNGKDKLIEAQLMRELEDDDLDQVTGGLGDMPAEYSLPFNTCNGLDLDKPRIIEESLPNISETDDADLMMQNIHYDNLNNYNMNLSDPAGIHPTTLTEHLPL